MPSGTNQALGGTTTTTQFQKTSGGVYGSHTGYGKSFAEVCHLNTSGSDIVTYLCLAEINNYNLF